jgi:16S rRNA (guanine1516-N2)-methyltransferase
MPNMAPYSYNIAVSYTHADNRREAQILAEELALPLIDGPQCEAVAPAYEFLLMLTPHYLELQKTITKKGPAFHIDFLSGKMLYRQKQAGLRKELIARAIGTAPRDKPTILDATAGLGRDSFVLASLGFAITMLERSPVLYVLLRDALERAKKSLPMAPVIANMHLLHADALDWLRGKHFNVIYLDPMFPERQKSAAVKKEMALLQDLLGKDGDTDNLLELALTCATHRVVVKRPRLAPPFTNRAPNFSLTGKSSRFDIYLAIKR